MRFFLAAILCFSILCLSICLSIQVAAAQGVVNHSDWQTLLSRYVVVDSNGINRVRYRDFSDEDRRQLTRYIDQLATVQPETLGKDEQFAYWVNLYNALTVRVVLLHPQAESIKKMGEGLLSFGPWSEKLVSVAGQAMSLDDIEHGILRTQWRERRVHYAVNCASLGCPNLQRVAYTGSNLQQLLAKAELEFVRHTRALRFTDDGQLVLSGLYEWYSEDFGDSEADLLEYLASFHPEWASRLKQYEGSISYEYDWSLNQAAE